MINYVKGDLFDMLEGQDAIIHGCNCFNTMGAGFAKQIAQRYPDAETADMRTAYGSSDKLGCYSDVFVDDIRIINAYTQYRTSTSKDVFEYCAFDTVLRKLELKDYFTLNNIIMPKIGSGLAHGNWELIEMIIKKYSRTFNFTVVEYQRA